MIDESPRALESASMESMLAAFKSLPPAPGVLGQSDEAMIRLIEEGRTNLADYRIRLAMEARQ